MTKLFNNEITGLKRKVWQEDFIELAPPTNENNCPIYLFKVMSDPIYFQEIGIYALVIWDFDDKNAKLLSLGHTLFSAFKRWRATWMLDIKGRDYNVLCKIKNNIIYHDLICRSEAPFLDKKIIEETNNYIDSLFELKLVKGKNIND